MKKFTKVPRGDVFANKNKNKYTKTEGFISGAENPLVKLPGMRLRNSEYWGSHCKDETRLRLLNASNMKEEINGSSV